MHSYCTKLFHCKILLCLRKERLHTSTLFGDFFFIDARVLSANSSSVQSNTRREQSLTQIAYTNVIDWYYCAATLLYIDRMLVFDFGNSVGNPT